MIDLINSNVDLIGWSIILAPFAYYGLKLAVIMVYIIIAGLFGEAR